MIVLHFKFHITFVIMFQHVTHIIDVTFYVTCAIWKFRSFWVKNCLSQYFSFTAFRTRPWNYKIFSVLNSWFLTSSLWTKKLKTHQNLRLTQTYWWQVEQVWSNSLKFLEIPPWWAQSRSLGPADGLLAAQLNQLVAGCGRPVWIKKDCYNIIRLGNSGQDFIPMLLFYKCLTQNSLLNSHELLSMRVEDSTFFGKTPTKKLM